MPGGRAGRGGAVLADRKSTQQLLQPEALLQLGPVQLTVVVLFQEWHEFVLPDPAQPAGFWAAFFMK
ncbi:hypothetical protein AHiyo1_16070 [Arthrobacter sp. Hiyo1]|nr:hypothetical protein AHiyo1_16070 [Arthrobacter sp. Hiyo1]